MGFAGERPTGQAIVMGTLALALFYDTPTTTCRPRGRYIGCHGQTSFTDAAPKRKHPPGRWRAHALIDQVRGRIEERWFAASPMRLFAGVAPRLRISWA